MTFCECGTVEVRPPQRYCYWCNPREQRSLFQTPGSEIPVPESLEGIYTRCGNWESYSPKTGYRKCACMILHINGSIYGPCWPNAGEFVSLEGKGRWLESGISAVAYFIADEESQNNS